MPGIGHRELVLSQNDDSDEPRHITVELGGHASAPSRDREDGFRIGRDVNWHTTQAWGTRDVLATTGTAFMGPYRTGMTYRRNVELGLNVVYRPHSRWDDDAVFPDRIADRNGVTCKADERAYDLLRVEPFEQLARAIDASDTDDALAALRQIEEEVVAQRRIGDELPAFAAPSRVTPEQLALLRAWRVGLFAADGEEMSAGKHTIWTREHYVGSPIRVLKEHLYPPSVISITSATEMSRLVTYGIGAVAYQGWELYGGFIIPEIPYVIAVPGLVEAQIGLAISNQNSPRETALTLALQFDSEYRQYFGWYARVAYMKGRDRILANPAARDVTASGGLSFLLWRDPLRYKRWLPINTFRLRVGPRVDVSRFGEFDFGRVGLEIFLSLRQ